MGFHGTDDGTIAYEGKCPGPPFLGEDVCVVPAQQTDFLIAQAMGYTGEQIPDSGGVEIAQNFVEYSYLENGLGVCIPKGASMGASHVLEVLHPAVEVAVLHEVLCDLNSAAVWDLLPRVAHRLGDQK